MNLLAKNFKKKLSAKGLDQLEVANKIGMSPSVLSRIINKHKDPRLSSIVKIASGLGVRPWELFIDEDEGDSGPLSEQEKVLISNFRTAASDTERKTIQDVAKGFAKK